MSEGAPGTTLSTEDLEVLKKAALELAERASALDDGAHAVRAVREAYERAFPLMEDYASALVDKDINAPEVMPAFRWLEKARRYLKENPPPVVDAELSKSEGSAAPEADDEWEGFLLRGETKGRPILPAPHNARVMLLHHPDLKNKLVWNTVTNTVDVRGGALAPYATKDLDTLISALMDYFTAVHGFSISRDELGRRLIEVAKMSEFDPIQDYLRSLRWDGVKRAARWLITYCGAQDTPDHYAEIIGRKWILSCGVRAMRPGSKVDTVLVMEGVQGGGKSSAFEILGGDWYADVSVTLGDKDSKVAIAPVWIAELPDMASFKKSEQNAMKAYFTSRVDRYRPPYGRGMVNQERRVVFGATTNEEQYFQDLTGNRRFLPVACGKIDNAALLRDRDQIWAEVMTWYNESLSCAACRATYNTVWNEPGRCRSHRHYLDPEEQALANEQTERRMEPSVYEGRVREWWFQLGTTAPSARSVDPMNFTLDDVLEGALKLSVDKWESNKRSAGVALRAIGFIKVDHGKGRCRFRYRPSEKLLMEREERRKKI
mgnify:CR=1 FL=1